MRDKKPTQHVPPYATNSVPVIVVGTIGWLIGLIVLLVTGTVR